MALSQIEALFRTKYNDEFKFDYERATAKLKMAVRSDGVVRGDTSKWDVVDPGDIAVQKGRNGRVPNSELGLSQVSATLLKHHKKYQIDNFDEFRGNPNIRSAMTKRGIASINRAIDQEIINAADASATAITASTNGASNQAVALSSLANVSHWMSFLLEADVPADDNELWAVISVKASLQIQRIAEFKSADYVDYKPMPNAPGSRVLRWQGVNWLTHNGLSGKGTAACKMYMFHKSALGHQVSGEPAPHLFDSEEDDYFGVRYDAMHCAKTCLPRGIVRFYHDDTAALS